MIRKLFMTLGLIFLLGGFGGCSYCISTLVEGTSECLGANVLQEELSAAHRQSESARGTNAYSKFTERLETLEEQVQNANYFCGESVFKYQAYAFIAGFASFFGGLFMAIARIMVRNRRFSYHWQS